MTFNDIFKSSFLENVTQFSPLDTLIGMLFALVIGLFIFVIYKKTFNGVMYSSSFALTLVGLALVTTLVIMAVTSNVVLSLGMVGALSIVRFRAVIKEPIEIVYLFWSIAAGIVIGAGIELTAEVRLKDAATSFVNGIQKIDGVDHVTLVSYNGEYMS